MITEYPEGTGNGLPRNQVAEGAVETHHLFSPKVTSAAKRFGTPRSRIINNRAFENNNHRFFYLPPGELEEGAHRGLGVGLTMMTGDRLWAVAKRVSGGNKRRPTYYFIIGNVDETNGYSSSRTISIWAYLNIHPATSRREYPMSWEWIRKADWQRGRRGLTGCFLQRTHQRRYDSEHLDRRLARSGTIISVYEAMPYAS
jgi:hypothetical protein